MADELRRGRVSNVVLVSLDTLRYDCIGPCPDKRHLNAYGLARALSTPNMDGFFEDCLYFTRAVTTAPYTTAAHASLMTGLYPNHHGVRPFYKWALAEGVGTLAEELKSHGYVTVAVEEGGDRSPLKTGTGVLRGFENFFTDEKEAAAFCRSAAGPVLLFIHTFDVHPPYCSSGLPEADSQNWAWRAALRRYYRRVGTGLRRDGPDETDKNAFFQWACNRARARLAPREASKLLLEWYVSGVNWFDRVRWPRIVGALKEAGLYDTSLVVVFSDHGEGLLPDFVGSPMSHSPSLLEDVLRIPLGLRAPDLPREQSGRPACITDLAPTVLDYLGIEARVTGRKGEMDGRSLLARPPGQEMDLFAEAWRTWRRAVRRGVLPKAMWQHDVDDPCAPYQVCIRSGAIKLTCQLGPARLWRFMTRVDRAVAQCGALLKRWTEALQPLRPFLLRMIPRRLWQGLSALRTRMRRALMPHAERISAPPPSRPSSRTAWREPPVFVVDLNEDPLEERPVRLRPSQVSGIYAPLVAKVRRYWEEGTHGPRIDVAPQAEKKVMQHLRDLGYVD